MTLAFKTVFVSVGVAAVTGTVLYVDETPWQSGTGFFSAIGDEFVDAFSSESFYVNPAAAFASLEALTAPAVGENPRVPSEVALPVIAEVPLPEPPLVRSANPRPAPRPSASALHEPSASPPAPPAAPPPSYPVPLYFFIPTIGSLGGGGGGITNPSRTETLNPNTAETDTTAPAAPVVLSPAASLVNSTSVLFSGTAEVGAVLSQTVSSSTAIAGSGGNWSLSVSLPEGGSTVLWYATDNAGNRSGAATSTVTVDTSAPSVTLSVTECDDSLLAGSCLITGTALSLSWTSTSTDVSYYTVDRNGSISTTTATALSATATDFTSYSAGVSATDGAGNRSATSTLSIRVHSLPIVVNEIAWAGTGASSSAEWFELYNNTGYSIPLSGWTLYATDLSPYIPLSGTIAPNAYFLIERSESATSVSSDLTVDFGTVDNNGESIRLARKGSGATTTIDTVATCSGGSTNWCYGSDSSYTSLERYDPLASGGSSSNFASHLGAYIRNGSDSLGSALNGTPKAKNSASYLIVNGNALASSKTLSASSSPYLISANLSVNSGVTLTVPAGVVVKVAGSRTLTVNGTLTATGSASSPVVFTSFYDDAYGGDTGNDGSATSPAAGNWKQILFNSGSGASSLAYTYILYGGDVSSGPQGAIGVSSAAPTFTEVRVATSSTHGIALSSSNATITGGTFTGNSSTAAVSSAGIYASDGSPSITSSAFSGNYRGVSFESSTATLFSNTFASNSAEAVHATGLLGSFSGNTGTGNFQNAIVIGHNTNITSSGATTTLAANSGLPYLIKKQATVASGSALAFGTGVVVKGHDNRSSNVGELIVSSGAHLYSSGTSTDALVLTSIRDTDFGGTTESGLGAAAAGDWRGITVNTGGRVDLSGFTIKFAGQRATNPFYGETEGAFKINGSSESSGTLYYALFSTNYQSGLNLSGVGSLSVSTTTMENHTEESAGTASAIYVANSTAAFTNITFIGNQKDAVGTGTNSLTCSNCGTPVTSPSNLFGS